MAEYAWSCLQCPAHGTGPKFDLDARKHEAATKDATSTHLAGGPDDVHDIPQIVNAILAAGWTRVTPPAKKGGPHSLTDCWCGEHHAREDFL